MSEAGFFAIVVLVIEVYCIWRVLKEKNSSVLRKTFWVLALFILPLLAIPLYILFFRK